MIDMPDYIDPHEGLVECGWCEGMFVPDDMTGEHCRDCAEKPFDGDAR